MMKTVSFLQKVRRKQTDFTRNRKVGFFTLLCLILRMIRKSTQLELDEFRRQFMPENYDATTYTKASFSEARDKLLPEAFALLNDEVVQQYYAIGDFKTFLGFRLLAIDGSVREVPNTKENQEVFGHVITQVKDFQLARARTSLLFDVENKIALHASLSKFSDSEKSLAKQNLDHLLTSPSTGVRDLILFDRGYPSLDLIQYLDQHGIAYLMRSSHHFLKEVVGTTTPDEVVRVTVTKKRAEKLAAKNVAVRAGETFVIRVLKVRLATGEEEILITNLSSDELPYEASRELYNKRWGIETCFNELKNKFEIENFSAQKPRLIEQDFLATIFLSNITSIMEEDAEAELKESQRTQTLQYDEYRINRSILIGKMRDPLIAVLLEEKPRKRAKMYRQLMAELQRHIIAVVPDRSFPRKKQPDANKYSSVKRRSL
ncbi:IS4 family transposase [Paenibacillus aurantiacus]|uniref:IS4 family transposase n=1 Tax=Paenibacillus aurantiacus TaxID=1936118 RepID=A0ABV5KR58_9BACL